MVGICTVGQLPIMSKLGKFETQGACEMALLLHCLAKQRGTGQAGQYWASCRSLSCRLQTGQGLCAGAGAVEGAGSCHTRGRGGAPEACDCPH